MIGKNHVLVSVSNVAALLAFKGAFLWSGTPILSRISRMIPWAHSVPGLDDWGCWGYAGLVFVCTAIGALLPDADKGRSSARNIIRLPFKHRTWTHCWAAVLLLSWLFRNPYTAYIFVGYVLHIVQDSLSHGGICFWYPFEQYRKYPTGAKVATHHKLRLYRTGKSSEAAAVHLFSGISLVCALYLGVWLGGFWMLA